jgi:hypothetical protein
MATAKERGRKMMEVARVALRSDAERDDTMAQPFFGKVPPPSSRDILSRRRPNLEPRTVGRGDPGGYG